MDRLDSINPTSLPTETCLLSQRAGWKIKPCKNGKQQSQVALRSMYSKTVYAKYTNLLNTLVLRQSNPSGMSRKCREQVDLGEQSGKDKVVKASQNQGGKQNDKAKNVATPIRIRVRRSVKLAEKGSQKVRERPHTKTDMRSMVPVKAQNSMPQLQNIYHYSVQKHKKQPQGITTKASYYGIPLAQKNTTLLLHELQLKLRCTDSEELVEAILRGVKFP